MKGSGESGSDGGERLLEAFPAASLEQWREEVVRLLKGASFEERMLSTTIEGITLRPIYTRADTAGLAHLHAPPGAPPYLRGGEVPGEPPLRWEVAQELPFPEPDEFNLQLRHDLERGQTAVNLVFDDASAAGVDPDRAGRDQVGRGGTSIATLDELDLALKGVDLERTPVYLDAGPAAPAAAALLRGLCAGRGADLGRVTGAVGFDPLARLAARGELPLSLERAWDGQALLTRWAAESAPGLRTVVVRGAVWHEAGASAVEELAFTMAGAVQALREAEQRGIGVQTAAPRCWFVLAVGTDFFTEIAKFRAARLLWARIVEACGAGAAAAKPAIHARSSGRSRTLLDPYTNILRATTEAFAAIAGGCSSLHVAPFDERAGLPGELARRLARNTQLILRDEAHFDRVADPAGGSWYAESLTDELARRAWDLFQQIEAGGGMERALREGRPQSMTAVTAEQRQRNLARRSDVLVGTSRYPDPDGTPLDLRVPDHGMLREEAAARLEVHRREAGAIRTRALERLAATAPAGGTADLELMTEAARQGATLGELCRWFSGSSAPAGGVRPVPALPLGRVFETLRARVSAAGPPRVLLAAMGPPAGYRARLEFARSFYQVGGFEVLGGEGFASPDEAATAVGRERPAAVCIVSRDERYPEVVRELAVRLRDADPVPVLHLAGGSREDEERYRRTGIRRRITLDSDLPEILDELADLTGVQR